MFGLSYLKAPPTSYVILFKAGKAVKQGAGLSFVYFAPTSTVVNVPLGSRDVPFAFQETTSDFQQVTVQGTLTWRVADPQRLAAMFNHAVDSRGTYQTDEPDLVTDWLTRTTQVLVRGVVGKQVLRAALKTAETLSRDVLLGLRADDGVTMMGVEVLGLTVLGVQPAPEMGRALEAQAREALQGQADEAIYARRRMAVEQERVIKETELNTEIAVEDKKRLIREKQMAADVSVEDARGVLVDRRVANDRKDADGRAYALEAVLKPVRDVDWRTLMAVGAGGGDSRLMIAMAFRELAENAGKIGTLNISPDLLQSLLAAPAVTGKK
jgi:regulator of protease activity HflC (stomatin/prohibitin superfamily)